MRSMRSMMRDFTFISCLVLVALVLALAWQGPFVQAGSANAASASQGLHAQPQHLSINK
jgi:hypothetical protein